MRNFLLISAAILGGSSLFAQSYITPAPQGGFNAKNGKDYVVLYAPASLVDQMGSKLISNNNLDPDQIDNTLQYWVTQWDSKDLTLYSVPAEEGDLNSFGEQEFINATPLYAWGTGVFVPKAKNYDLSAVTPNHHIHIGLRDFGSAPSKYKFSIGSQKTITTNGFQIMVGIALGATDENFVGVGALPAGNDGKWYYLDIPVADLIDENGDFGFSYNFSNPITDGVFTFTFSDPVCSTATKTGPEPGESVYSYEITNLGSALSLDHVFFYVPDTSGVEGIFTDDAESGETYYDLSGRRVANPGKGLYIVKSEAGVRKVII